MLIHSLFEEFSDKLLKVKVFRSEAEYMKKKRSFELALNKWYSKFIKYM